MFWPCISLGGWNVGKAPLRKGSCHKVTEGSLLYFSGLLLYQGENASAPDLT